MNLFGFHVGVLILGHSVTNSEMGNPKYEIGTYKVKSEEMILSAVLWSRPCTLISAVFAAPLTCHVVGLQLLISSALLIDCTRSLWTGATCLQPIFI